MLNYSSKQKTLQACEKEELTGLKKKKNFLSILNLKIDISAMITYKSDLDCLPNAFLVISL